MQQIASFEPIFSKKLQLLRGHIPPHTPPLRRSSATAAADEPFLTSKHLPPPHTHTSKIVPPPMYSLSGGGASSVAGKTLYSYRIVYFGEYFRTNLIGRWNKIPVLRAQPTQIARYGRTSVPYKWLHRPFAWSSTVGNNYISILHPSTPMILHMSALFRRDKKGSFSSLADKHISYIIVKNSFQCFVIKLDK